MRVLLTNDDGIAAKGINAVRKALRGIDGIELSVIAPHVNRSAIGRGITTRSPIWVEEITFDDGSTGFATEGTPVDCVRFADLGLLGDPPDLIVSGINHGANLGDDVTYSGTVAAAFEGIILGVPAIALSQQSRAGEMDFRLGRNFDFDYGAAFAARLVEHVGEHKMPEGTIVSVNFPAGKPTGIEVTRLGKRLYNDSLKLIEEEGEVRRRYEIYGFDPSFEDEEGTDLSAVARGRISVTPIHFDLTDHGGIDKVKGWKLDEMLEGVHAAEGAQSDGAPTGRPRTRSGGAGR